MAPLDGSPADRLDAAVRRRPGLWRLLATLVVLQFGYPITLLGQGWTLIYLLAYVGVIAFAVQRANTDRRRYWPLFVASVALVAGAVWFGFQQSSTSATAAMLAGMGLLQVSLVIVLTQSLVHPPRGAHTLDMLLVAVCTYLLLGGVFGVLASLVELGAPGSFADGGVTGLGWQDLVYGSYVTLATLGFGDIVPISAWARSLWSFEAVIGILYVAVVIARLVGVAGFAPRDGDEAPETGDS